MTAKRAIPLWIAIFLLAGIFIGPREFSAGDTQRYVGMVEGETVVAPFAYRVLVPAIVRVLPVSVESGFLITTIAFSYLTLLFFHRLLRRLGVAERAALLTTAALAFSYPVAYNLGHWGLIDPATNFFIVLALYALFSDRLWLMAAILLIGVMAKESLLLLLPLLVGAIWWRPTLSPVARVGYTLLAAGTLLLVLALLRTRIPVEPSVYDIGGLDDLRALWAFIMEYNFSGYGFIPRLGREFLRSYGFFWTFALLGWSLIARRSVQVVCLYLVAVSVGLCLIATDWSRMLSFGFPGIFIPAAFLIQRGLAEIHGRWLMPALVVLFAAQGYIALLSYEELDRLGQLGLIVGSVLLFIAGSLLAVYLRVGATRRKLALEQKG